MALMLALLLLSLGMGANGYIAPTSDAERERRGDLDYVAPGTQEHLLRPNMRNRRGSKCK